MSRIIGCECDQCFSVLTTEFKRENIYSVDDLVEKIILSPIQPTPICQELDYIFNWKEYVIPHLEDPELKYHTKYNSFIFQLENGKTVLR